MKKILTGLIVILMLTGMTVSAEEETIWNFDSEAYTLREYTGTDTNVVVPDTLDGVPVKVLYMSCLGSSDTLTSVVLPDSVTVLRNGALSFCENLTQITLSENLISIGRGCLGSNHALTEITIPASVCYMRGDALGFCFNMQKIVFEGACPVFYSQALCALPDDVVVYVPDDQLEAYQKVFEENDLMLEIQPSGKPAVLHTPDEYLDTENLIFDAETGTITGYEGTNARLTIPETIDGVPVKSIGKRAFAFHDILSYLTLPEGLEEIEDEAFTDVQTLYYVEFPSTLKRIGDYAFRGYGGDDLNLPEGLEYIGKGAFIYAAPTQDLIIPEGVKEIGPSAFASMVWTSNVYLPSTLEKLDEECFKNASLTYVYMDGTTLPEIADTAFAECSNLRDIDLNEHCTRQQMLDVQEIVDAQGLECRVWRNQNTETVAAHFSIVENPDDPNTLYISGYEEDLPKVRSYGTYSDDEKEWKITGVADGALKGDQTITYFAVNHNDLFTYIGKEAFAESLVEHVDLFDSVTTIGAEAFRDCTKLKEITIPASVTEIGENAFAGCSGLTQVNILCDVGLLPEGAFAGCENLTEATVMTGSIPARLFEESGLTTLHMGDGVTAIGARAFAGTSLNEFIIPTNIPVDGESLEGVSPECIRISADATDEQVAEWAAVLDYPWYDTLHRVGEEPSLVKMPYEPLAEDNFEFDPDTRTITAYTGTAVDVIIPRTIDGVPVENISYNAFECARDYLTSEMATNQEEGDWIPMRCLILPETLKSIEDSAFMDCHDLETVICYAPLENTNKGVFQELQGLKTVIFVNGVRQMDNYLFNYCKNLKTVWCKNQVDRIGMQCFGVTGLEQICVNAKDIDYSAFIGSESLKEIHIRSGVERLNLTAFGMLTGIETICLEGVDPNVLETDWVNLENSSVTILVPEDTTDEQMQLLAQKFQGSAIITDASQVKRGTCQMPENPMPDIAEILSAYGIS